MKTLTIAEPSVSVIKSEINLLTKHDRCDRCGAQAYGRSTVRSSGFTLMWCGHHLAKLMPTLLVSSSKIEDYRQALVEKP